MDQEEALPRGETETDRETLAVEEKLERPVEKEGQAETDAIDGLKKEVKDLNDRYLRLYAEFDNYKRRTLKERADLLGSAQKKVLLALLPVLDDLERAGKSFEDAKEIEPLKAGVQLVFSKLKTVVAHQGLKEMTSMGEVFDTDKHEAITNIPAPTEALKGKVIDELEKGYELNDKVIRFAKVIVGI